MKTVFMATLLFLASTAHAKQFSCNGAGDAIGMVTLNCDEATCTLDHSTLAIKSATGELNLEDCDTTRRPETQAKMFQKVAYYDVQGDSCWANYIRVSKAMLTSGEGQASLVKTSGGDTHDNSGYQYLYLDCQ